MDTKTFKKMCRMLDVQRRLYFEQNWPALSKGTSASALSSRQVIHLMMIRLKMPCNLNQVMLLTGLSSSAASIFVDKLVKTNVVYREIDARDRRNILIVPTEETKSLLSSVDRGLDAFIDHWLTGCTESEIQVLEKAGELICGRLDAHMKEWE